jgi:hypothetical protein
VEKNSLVKTDIDVETKPLQQHELFHLDVEYFLLTKHRSVASSSLLWNKKHSTEKKETQNVLHPAMCRKKPSSVIIREERVPEFHSVELPVVIVLMVTRCVCRP